MAGQNPEVIKNYDVVFGVRTGVTILIPKNATFDCGVDAKVQFNLSPDNPADVMITAADKSAVLKDLRKDYIDDAVKRGVIMFYETKDDEVVRCTPCNYQQK
ncbi:MAG: hypothetical protein PW788_02385 [Micavibrio sp.]|nr:hypothetical protein [Micavibrio sp.]